MKLYIPKYIVGRVPVFNQLRRLIEGYTSEFGDTENEDYYYYYYYYGLRIDDVTRFLDYVYPRTEDDEVRNNILTYLSCLFYSVKGTSKVIEYLTKFNILSSTSMVTYDSQTVNISIELLPEGTKYEYFCEYLEKFLTALLWVKTINITIESSEADISGSTTTCISCDLSNNYMRYELEL